MSCQSLGLVDGVERDDVICIRDVLVLTTPTHEEDSVQCRSPKTYSWRRKIAHLSPLSLRAIFHHLRRKLKKGTFNDISDFCNSNAPLCWTKRLLQTPLLLRSASTTFKIHQLHMSELSWHTLLIPVLYSPQACWYLRSENCTHNSKIKKYFTCLAWAQLGLFFQPVQAQENRTLWPDYLCRAGDPQSRRMCWDQFEWNSAPFVLGSQEQSWSCSVPHQQELVQWW